LLQGWAPIIASIDLLPSSKGRFEVSLDDEVIFSKASLGRHAAPAEIAALVSDRLGPEIPRD
jgi:predicted Rdx family selenoprotein